MKAAWLVLGFSLVALLPIRAEEVASPPPPLRFDPFRPLDSLPRSSAFAPDSGGLGLFEPVLRGALAAGDRSLANLGGVVLRLGEEAGGYRLVEVREREAVFTKDGAELVLQLDPPEQRSP